MAFFIVATGFATETLSLDVFAVEAEKVLVDFRSKTPTLLELTLQNSDGEIVYYSKSETLLSKYKEVLDFTEMEKGMYTICMNYGNCSVNCELFVSKNNIKIGPLVQLYEPYFCLENGILNVSFLNVTQKNVYLNIYQNDKYLTGNCLGKDMALQKRLDISNLKGERYQLVLTDWFIDHPFVVQM